MNNYDGSSIKLNSSTQHYLRKGRADRSAGASGGGRIRARAAYMQYSLNIQKELYFSYTLESDGQKDEYMFVRSLLS